MFIERAINFPASRKRRRNSRAVRTFAQLLILVLAFRLGAFPLAATAQTPTNELRTAADVRGLTVEQAQQPMRVHLRGVVTFWSEKLYSRFIQDDTAGIYLQFNPHTPPLTPGQIVEVEGVSSPGEYAPVVVPEQVRVLGEGKLPPARPVTYEQLASGGEDSQFVEITGVVRSVQRDVASQFYLVNIATGGGRIWAFTRELPVKQIAELTDSTVRVRGVCSALFSHQRQLFAIRLMVPRTEDLVIEQPAPSDPFVVATRPIGSLLQFAPQESFGHRVKVAGTVTYFEPGRRLFLQDSEQGVEVQTDSRKPLQVGDYVEALGFVGRGEYSPVLQDAVYRKLGIAPPLAPATLTQDEALKGRYDCRLVQVTARLLDRALHGADRYLILQDGSFIFHAYLRQSGGLDAFARLENGSRVAVTGICRIDAFPIDPNEWYAGENWRAKSFRIEMRSPDDVKLLAVPSWWTLKRVLWIAGALCFVTLAAFGWVAVLRRQVTERTRELEMEIEERQHAERQHAIEQERTRVAQDLHDELGATLTEVSLLGAMIQTPSVPAETRGRYVSKLAETARAVVGTLDEIVWAVNPKYDSVDSLASYYSLFAQRFLKLAGIGCRLQMAETFPATALDSRLRHGVFLAFKEALNNAVRHSGASEVRINMEVVGGQLTIAVSDNGKGFSRVGEQPGCDGLAGMRERLADLGGACRISSQPGTGTTVEFRLPLGGVVS